MGLLGDGAVRHGAGREPLHDLGDGFHLLQRHRRARPERELEQAAQRHEPPRLVVHPARVLLEDVVAALTGGVLQPEDRLGVEQVRRALAAPLVLAADLERPVGVDPLLHRVAEVVTRLDVAGDLGQADPLDPGGRAGEVALHERARQAEGLEDLRAGVRRDRRDAHLAHHLEHALAERLAHVAHRLLRLDGHAVDLAAGEVLGRLERQVGVDRRGAVADEQRHVVDLPDVAGLDDQPDLRAGLLADEVLVHGGGEQERRDGREVDVGVPVGQDDGPGAAGDRLAHLCADLVEAPLELLGPVEEAVEPPDNVRVELRHGPVPVDPDQLGQLVAVQDRVVDDDLPARVRAGRQQVGLGPHGGRERRHEFLADRVQRRVRHLGEQLREVVEQQPGAVADRGHRGVGAHRPDRLGAGLRHGRDDRPDLLEGVAEHLLAPGDRRGRVDDVLPLGEVGQVDAPTGDPVAVGVLGRQLGLDLVVVDQPVLLQVDQQHPARLETALLDDPVLRDVEDAGLGAEDDQTVVGDPVAARPQAVAVEGGPDEGAVGEADRRRAVPRLHHGAVERVEVAAGGVHLAVVLPRLGDHHEDRVRQRASAQVQQFEHLVEGRRVGRAGRADGEAALEVARDQVGLEQGLAGPHPVAVALDGVDLAVVRDHAEGVRQLPAREGVGREAAVHQRQGALGAPVGQVGEHLGELRGGQHALVDRGAGAQGREVDVGLVAGALAQGVHPAVEVEPRRLPAGHEQLLHDGHRRDGHGAEGGGRRRHVAPPEDPQALLDRDVLDGALGGGALDPVGGEERHADGVVAGGGKVEGHRLPEQAVGDLQEHARPVAGRLIGAGGAPVVEVLQRGDALGDDLVARLAAEAGDERDATGIVLELVEVEAFGRPRGHVRQLSLRSSSGLCGSRPPTTFLATPHGATDTLGHACVGRVTSRPARPPCGARARSRRRARGARTMPGRRAGRSGAGAPARSPARSGRSPRRRAPRGR